MYHRLGCSLIKTQYFMNFYTNIYAQTQRQAKVVIIIESSQNAVDLCWHAVPVPRCRTDIVGVYNIGTFVHIYNCYCFIVVLLLHLCLVSCWLSYISQQSSNQLYSTFILSLNFPCYSVIKALFCTVMWQVSIFMTPYLIGF